MASIPCPACGTVPPDDYCADCDIIVSHDKHDETGWDCSTCGELHDDDDCEED
jgi:hypothetical protein